VQQIDDSVDFEVRRRRERLHSPFAAAGDRAGTLRLRRRPFREALHAVPYLYWPLDHSQRRRHPRPRRPRAVFCLRDCD
jgi:hypothetical protein